MSDTRFETHATSESHFSWLRTRLSLERTLMSWVRTGIALIGFGFTIVQFFDRLRTMQGVAPARVSEAPRYLGLALIGAGVIGLTIGVIEYRQMIRYLWRPEFAAVAGVAQRPGHTPLFAVALLLIAIGLVAFVVVFMRLA